MGTFTGRKHTEESKRKISIAKLGKPSPNKDKKFTDKWRKNLSESHKGIKCSEQAKKKLSDYLKAGNSKFLIDGREKIPGYRDWKKGENTRMRRTNGGSHTFKEWQNLKAQYNCTCPCCKKIEPEIKLSQDHIIPVSKGGLDNIENLQPLCMPCNIRKYNKTIKYNPILSEKIGEEL